MVGDLEKSSFSNIEQQSLEFVKYTLDPWVVRWEQALYRTLLSEEEKKVSLVFHAAPKEAEAKAEKYGRRALVFDNTPLVSKRMDTPSFTAFSAALLYFSTRILGSTKEERDTITFSIPDTEAISIYWMRVFSSAIVSSRSMG